MKMAYSKVLLLLSLILAGILFISPEVSARELAETYSKTQEAQKEAASAEEVKPDYYGGYHHGGYGGYHHGGYGGYGHGGYGHGGYGHGGYGHGGYGHGGYGHGGYGHGGYGGHVGYYPPHDTERKTQETDMTRVNYYHGGYGHGGYGHGGYGHGGYGHGGYGHGGYGHGGYGHGGYGHGGYGHGGYGHGGYGGYRPPQDKETENEN